MDVHLPVVVALTVAEDDPNQKNEMKLEKVNVIMYDENNLLNWRVIFTINNCENHRHPIA